MSIEQRIADMEHAAAEQTAASQALSQEVSSKMGVIDSRLSHAQGVFESFVGGEFDLNVYNAGVKSVFVDPLDGNDGNDGSTSTKSVKTFDGILSVVGSTRYQELTISIRKGQQLAITGQLIVAGVLRVEGWTHSNGETDRPVIYQQQANGCNLYASEIWFNTVEIKTYTATANEVLPQVFSHRALFRTDCKVSFVSTHVHICDNQLFHVHDGGAGDKFHRRSISWYMSTLYLQPSHSGVTGTQKRIFSRYTSLISFPIDMFAVNMLVVLNGQVAALRNCIGVPDENILTNINLDMVG
ncbi:hypothetical protein [Pseudoalteromonas sp. Of7M-16]|uniref:hypothetical protein n=1 Tax=Pseudoalteromonas sp. Of7M-16 TaxID=2917756 RepID=UPI001EF53B20|nr:hypothetical protein [Pseudoalteromonas sp. Of7M-16]MCG7551575.1 hypothetical protein [Pseudoalteromonas sp. Of7M-16]